MSKARYRVVVDVPDTPTLPEGKPAEVVAHGERQTRSGGREFYARVVTRNDKGRVVRSSERTFESAAALAAFVAHPSIKPMQISATRRAAGMTRHQVDVVGAEAARPVRRVDTTDVLYQKLHGAREALCLAQMLLGEHAAGRRLLGKAVANIDQVGVVWCPQWSKHDRDFELEDGAP